MSKSRTNYDDTYSVTFFVYANENHVYNGISNLTEFAISFNEEVFFRKTFRANIDIYKAFDSELYLLENGRYSEARWNYASLAQDENNIIDDEGYAILLKWYEQEKIKNIGSLEDESLMYDEHMNYIGKGAPGYYELLQVITRIAKSIQEDDFFLKKSRKRIPIILQDLESTYYTTDATIEANIHDEAADYIFYIKNL